MSQKSKIANENQDSVANDKILSDPNMFRSFLTTEERWVFEYIIAKKSALSIHEIYASYLNEFYQKLNRKLVYWREKDEYGKVMIDYSWWYNNGKRIITENAVTELFCRRINVFEHYEALEKGYLYVDDKKYPYSDFFIESDKDLEINQNGEIVKEHESALRRKGVKFATYVTIKESVLTLESWGILTRRKKGKRDLFVLSPSWLLKYKQYYE